jgi:hypothetical protein
MDNGKKCFVIMPFSRTYKLTKEQWTEIFEHTIKPAVEESGCNYKCARYELRRANITKDILDELNKAHVVIADLTGSNPNVLWELGIRHVLSKRTILIAQDKRFLPSDLKDYPITTYKYQQIPKEVTEFRQEIKDKLVDIDSNPDKLDSPVADFLQLKNIDILDYEKSANLKKMSALISEMSRNLQFIDPILKMRQENQEARKKRKQTGVSSLRLENNCLTLLLTDLYILPTEELLKSLSTVNIFIIAMNSRLELWANESFGNSVEETLIEGLPLMKEVLRTYMRDINKIRIDYINDNYPEIKVAPVILASPEHEEYLKDKITP